MKIVLVTKSKDLAKTVSLFLKVRWPDLTLVSSDGAREPIDLIYRDHPDMVMLDHAMASVDCFDLISQIRSFSDIGIIVLSQTDDTVDKVRALQMGADDWMTPSTVPMEFIARVSVILRRSVPQSDNHASSLVNGKLGINYATHEVFVSGKQVKLTPIEYKILCHLAQNEGGVVNSAELLRRVWGPNYESDKEILKINIFRLRSKIEEDPANPQIVLSERGVGYTIRPLESTPQPSLL